MRERRILTALLVTAMALIAAEADRTTRSQGKVVNGIERLLYVTGKTGVSIYDINDDHKLLRKIRCTRYGRLQGHLRERVSSASCTSLRI